MLFNAEDERHFWHKPLRELPGFKCLWLAESLKSAAGANVQTPVTTWPHLTGSLTYPTLATANKRPYLQAPAGLEGQALYFAEASGAPYDGVHDHLEGLATEHLGSAANGLTMFAVFMQASATAGPLMSKYGDSGATREFRFGSAFTYIFDPTAPAGTHYTSVSVVSADTNWHIMIATWIPGSAIRGFRDGTTVTAGSNTGASGGVSIKLDDDTTPLKIGQQSVGTPVSFLGHIACLGVCDYGFATGSTEIATIYNTLNTRYF